MDIQLSINSLEQEAVSTNDFAKKMEILTKIARIKDEKEETNKQDPSQPTSGETGSGKPTIPTKDRSEGFKGTLLGADTTGLAVTSNLKMTAIPTGIYHLLKKGDQPLAEVKVRYVSKNWGDKAKRVSVLGWIEGISAKEYQTKEIKRDEEAIFYLLPTMLPSALKEMNEIGRCTLQIEVNDLDAKTELLESHTVMYLAKSSGIRFIKDPTNNTNVKMTQYLGAWVTPHEKEVQKVLREAAAKEINPYGAIFGYQNNGEPHPLETQIKAIFLTLKKRELRYVSSSLCFQTAGFELTQRVRLPKESLADQSINCLDGTVLFASLLEAAGIHSGLVFIPGHAFVGWKQDPKDDNSWQYLETTVVADQDYETARKQGSLYLLNPTIGAKHWKEELPSLRMSGIFPME